MLFYYVTLDLPILICASVCHEVVRIVLTNKDFILPPSIALPYINGHAVTKTVPQLPH